MNALAIMGNKAILSIRGKGEFIMPARKYKTDPAQLLAEGQQIVHSTSDAKYRHKVEMVNLVISGLTPSYLSTYCGHSKTNDHVMGKDCRRAGI